MEEITTTADFDVSAASASPRARRTLETTTQAGWTSAAQPQSNATGSGWDQHVTSASPLDSSGKDAPPAPSISGSWKDAKVTQSSAPPSRAPNAGPTAENGIQKAAVPPQDGDAPKPPVRPAGVSGLAGFFFESSNSESPNRVI